MNAIVPSDKSEISSSQDIVNRAFRESLFAPDADISWLKTNPSGLALQDYAAKLVGDKTRDYSGVLEITHYNESAIWGYNCPAKAFKGVLPEIVAYVFYAHDLEEDTGTPEKEIVQNTWRGNPIFVPFLIDALQHFSHPKNISKAAELRSQVQQAEVAQTALVSLGLYGEKYCTYTRDFWSIDRDIMTFENRTAADDYLNDKLRPRNWVIQRLPIDDSYKEQFVGLCARIESAIDRQLKRKAMGLSLAADESVKRIYTPKSSPNRAPGLVGRTVIEQLEMHPGN